MIRISQKRYWFQGTQKICKYKGRQGTLVSIMLNSENLLETRELSGLGPCRKSWCVGHQYSNHNNLTLYYSNEPKGW
jgi:hypothetical protein